MRNLLLCPFIILFVANVGASDLPMADKVLVYKSERVMYLLNNGEYFREYSISLGQNPVGDKMSEGDDRTPEGYYVLDWRNENSKYHKSIHISYPNRWDVVEAKNMGVPPGGNIMIHGYPDDATSQKLVLSSLKQDWTNGCIAVSNRDMDEIWDIVKNGTVIEIRP
ncbi:MAG: murein L,D-transpeptidase family protein [Gammaproteobacteria bacterium]